MIEFLQSFSKLEFEKVKAQIRRYIISPIGAEYLENMLPSSNIEEIRHSLSLVSEAKRILEVFGDIPLSFFPDVRKSLMRTSIEEFILPPKDIFSTGILISVSHKIISFFNRIKSEYPNIFSIVNCIYQNKIIEYNINITFDEYGNIKDDASKELYSIRKLIIEKNLQLRNCLEAILKKVSGKDWVQDEIVTTRDGRMVIPIKIEHKNKVPGFIHSTSSSGATVFIEPTETLELNNEIRTLQFNEQKEIEKILKNLTKQISEVREQLIKNAEILGKLDFIFSKAKYSIEIMGNEPKLKEQGPFQFIDARHPLLLLRHKREEVIPLNMKLDNSVKVILITGPNAGGKTVALKTVGLLTIMAQSACHIPANPESEIRIFKKIFVDIGDEQSIENDLSSFSSHLKNLSEILENADENSLVLIDEIASGTDPEEGSAIASAVLEFLNSNNTMTLSTTHNSTLKSFAHATPGIINAGMEFDQQYLSPTYRLLLGIPGSSYGIEMASRMNLKQSVVERAKNLRGKIQMNLENLLSELQRNIQQKNQELHLLKQERIELDKLKEFYESQSNLLKKELKSIKKKSLSEAEDLIRNMKSEIEKAIHDIRSSQANARTIKSARDSVIKIENEIKHQKNLLQESEINYSNYNVGDFVHLKESNAIGEIIQIIDDDNYLVVIGNVKVKVNKSNIEPQCKASPIEKEYTRGIYINREPQRVIDIRGTKKDEAIERIEKFIDDAILSNLQTIEIIHGKGSGRLKKIVTEYLKDNKLVKSYRFGEWHEGGIGVTIVELV